MQSSLSRTSPPPAPENAVGGGVRVSTGRLEIREWQTTEPDIVRYFEEHREEILAENQKILERIARGNPPEVEAKLQVSLAKLRARIAEREQKRLQEANGEGNPG